MKLVEVHVSWPWHSRILKIKKEESTFSYCLSFCPGVGWPSLILAIIILIFVVLEDLSVTSLAQFDVLCPPFCIFYVFFSLKWTLVINKQKSSHECAWGYISSNPSIARDTNNTKERIFRLPQAKYVGMMCQKRWYLNACILLRTTNN